MHSVEGVNDFSLRRQRAVNFTFSVFLAAMGSGLSLSERVACGLLRVA